ncbi:hypothetical protein F4819DRAFT_491208 [Hypoxylon fuscum]|nr:hypothetical protein F4819DRAFT_491208 [Hypoxylon fuscum]
MDSLFTPHTRSSTNPQVTQSSADMSDPPSPITNHGARLLQRTHRNLKRLNDLQDDASDTRTRSVHARHARNSQQRTPLPSLPSSRLHPRTPLPSLPSSRPQPQTPLPTLPPSRPLTQVPLPSPQPSQVESEMRTCPQCNKSIFKNERTLLQHINDVHIGTHCFWPGCSVTTESEHDLNKHLKTHNDAIGEGVPGGKMRCNWPSCGKDCTRAETVARHLRRHTSKARKDSEQ